jgi:hypothetical protein
MVRKRGSGLLRTAGRAAVIAGTATAVSGRVARRQQRNFAAEQASQAGGRSVTPAQSDAAAAGESDFIASLERLAALHSAGELSDGEFRSAKARILAH